MNHKIASLVFALAVGVGVALFAYQRVSDPLPGLQREEEERIVLLARAALREVIASVDTPAAELIVVDPLAPNRVAGKVYVYPTDEGWSVSGHYRRGLEDTWHPWLMQLDRDGALQNLAVRDSDPDLMRRAANSMELSVEP